MALNVRLKRIYNEPAPDDGLRVLVDRLWPRGVSREAARIDTWLKEIAPSDELRRWFGHDPARWDEFRRRYREELQDKSDQITQLQSTAEKGAVTLLFAARNNEQNNAVVLKEVIELHR
jgi:uncharacterized protein YeaO (DUF488 family)